MAFNPDFYAPDWPDVRSRILSRDGFRCVACGSPEGLSVHHKNGNSLDDRDENLTTLCRPDHLKADRYLHSKRQRATWQRKREAAYAQEIFD